MTADPGMYAVVVFDADGRPCDDPPAEVISIIDEAVHYRDLIATDEVDARVFRMEPLSDSAHWDWGVLRGGDPGTPVMAYVHEQAARNCARDGDIVVRRRRGSQMWEAAPA